MKNILVVEDEAAIREVIVLNLQMAGYNVTQADSAEAAQKQLVEGARFDIALLDVMLPGLSGFALCEQLRTQSDEIGIIILSAKSQERDKLHGLAIGADDYVTKPFSVSELLARVEALGRRIGRKTEVQAGRLVSGPFALDKQSRILTKDGAAIDLTQIEYQIIELFFENAGVALSRDKILEGVWGKNYYGDVKIVDVNIRRLRMKIEKEPGEPNFILTVWGYGYRWSPAE